MKELYSLSFPSPVNLDSVILRYFLSLFDLLTSKKYVRAPNRMCEDFNFTVLLVPFVMRLTPSLVCQSFRDGGLNSSQIFCGFEV